MEHKNFLQLQIPPPLLPKVSTIDITALQQQVLPASGVTLPITWKNLGKRMVADGVIDENQISQDFFSSGVTPEEEIMLTGDSTQLIVMNANNSRFL